MTDLTEQWRKGKLPIGYYYVRTMFGTKIRRCIVKGERRTVIEDFDTEQVLAEVPDYIEWQNMVKCACEEHRANTELLEENAQLKELLKEIRGKIKTVYDIDYMEFITSAEFDDAFVAKIDEVLK